MISFSIEKNFPRIGRAHGHAFRLRTEMRFAAGTFIGISGPSGCGKSTLLRCIAGLERPDEGLIMAGDRCWYSRREKFFLPPQKRGVGFVFQDYALFPHLTVLGNVMYAAENERTARELLDLTRLEEFASHFPRELSGGQKQRTALARALARRPDLLLLDEPLSAVDEELRSELGSEIRRIQRETGISAIMVSHSAAELDRLCDETRSLANERADLPAQYRIKLPVSSVP